MNIINSYFFGKITVNGYIYFSDIIISPNNVQSDWHRGKRHYLSFNDIYSIIERKPDVLIIGTGMFGLMRVDNNMIEDLIERGVHNIIIEKTKQACILYNKEKTRKKVAVLHITC